MSVLNKDYRLIGQAQPPGPRLKRTTGSTLWVLEDTTQVCFHGKLLVRHMKTVLEGKLAGIDFFLYNTWIFQELSRNFGKVSWSEHAVWIPCAASLAGWAERDMT